MGHTGEKFLHRRDLALSIQRRYVKAIPTKIFEWWFHDRHGYMMLNCQANVAPPLDNEAFDCGWMPSNEFGIKVYLCGSRKSKTTGVRVTDKDMYNAAHQVSIELDLCEEDG